MIDFAVARSEGKLVRVGEPFDTAPFGMGVKKKNPLGKALAATMQTMMNDGTYEAILKQWELEDGALDAVTFNLKPYQLPHTLEPKEGIK